jgi:amino acid permease
MGDHVLTSSNSVLGWVPGIITMVVAGALFYITSLTMHKFIMKHPQIKDIATSGTTLLASRASRTNLPQ